MGLTGLGLIRSRSFLLSTFLNLDCIHVCVGLGMKIGHNVE